MVGALLLALSACGTSTSSSAPAGSTSNGLYDVSASTVDGADWDGADIAGELARTHGDDVAVVGVGAQDDARHRPRLPVRATGLQGSLPLPHPAATMGSTGGGCLLADGLPELAVLAVLAATAPDPGRRWCARPRGARPP